MAEIVNFSKQDVTVRATNATSSEEVTAYTVSWSDLTTAGFANGDDVIVFIRAVGNALGTTTLAISEFSVGTTFAGRSILQTDSTESDSADSGVGGREIGFLDRRTLVTNENFYTSLSTSVGAKAAELQDYCFFIMKLDDLAADDFRYNEDTSSGDAPETLTDGASVTLPSTSGDDWLVLGQTNWLVDAMSVASLSQLTLDGNSRMVQQWEGEDTTETLSNIMVGYLPAAATSAVCKVQYQDLAGGTNDYTRSAIFALRMEAFVDHIGNYSSSGTAMGGVVDTWVQTNTASLSLTSTGDVAWFAQTIADVSRATQEPYHRVQVDGTDIVTSLGNIGSAAYDAADQLPLTQFGTANMTSGTKVIDVDCAESLNATDYNFDEHSLVAFSMELAGGGTSVNAEPSGAAAAGQAGTSASTVSIDVSATGAQSAGEAQAPADVTGDANYTLIGAATVGEADAVTVTGDVSVDATGAQTAGEAGTSTVTVDISTAPTGAEISGDAGTSTSFAGTPVPVTGAQSAGEAGTVTPTYDWAQTATGSQIAAEAGTSSVTVDISTAPTGAEISGDAGTVTVDIGITASPTGAEISGDSGAVTVTGDANITLTGAATAGEAGTSTAVTPDAIVDITGAESAAEAGTVTASVPSAKTKELGPHGLVTKYGTFGRDLSVSLVGAQSNATSGNVTVDVTVATVLSEFGPHGLTSKERNFAPKQQAQQNVNAAITGAQIEGQFATPDSANALIYIDSAEGAAEAGTVVADSSEDALIQITGAEIAGEAGTSTTDSSIDAAVTGAEISADSGDVTGIGNSSGVAQVSGAEISADAGTVTLSTDANTSVSGAVINAQPSEIGLDFKTGVSATITGAKISANATAPALAGPHVTINLVGGEISAEAGDPTVPQAITGGGWEPLYDKYSVYNKRKSKRKEYVKTIENPVDREIAELIEDDVEELGELISRSYSDEDYERAKAYNERVAEAYRRAYLQGNYSAIMAFSREMDRAIEEEEFLLLAMMILD